MSFWKKIWELSQTFDSHSDAIRRKCGGGRFLSFMKIVEWFLTGSLIRQNEFLESFHVGKLKSVFDFQIWVSSSNTLS